MPTGGWLNTADGTSLVVRSGGRAVEQRRRDGHAFGDRHRVSWMRSVTSPIA